MSIIMLSCTLRLINHCSLGRLQIIPMWVQFLRGGVIAVAESAGVIRSDLAEPAYSTCCLSVHEVKLLYVRYDALMNATDVWEDMNMICRYIDEVHTHTISCGLHNMSIYIRRFSFEAPPNN